jgi:KDEL-tailed cysteine endopeptidase
VCMSACMCASVRPCVRASVRPCVRASVSVCGCGRWGVPVGRLRHVRGTSHAQTIETAWAISTGKLVKFPVRQLIDCGGGCSGGGVPSQVYTYVHDHGLCAEYPAGRPGTCQRCTPTMPPQWLSGVVQVNASVNSLSAAVASTGVAVGVDAAAIVEYRGGIFEGPCGTTINHEMALVGYGTDAGRDYWILQNSWGSKWGEDGYMRLSRDVPANEPAGLCGILSAATHTYHIKA